VTKNKQDEYVENTENQNDDIIGVAFKWSVIVILLIAVIAGGAWFVFGRSTPETEVIIEKDPGSIASLVVEQEERPDIMFTDIASSAGITFTHRDGSTGEKLLPETMVGGGAFLDYDGDGDQDILLVSGTEWPHTSPNTNQPSSIGLYANNGAGAFTDVTEQAGLNTQIYGMGLACGDYDGDGDIDFFVTAIGSNRLYENRDGVFFDTTENAGVAGNPEGWSSSAGFFDADNDGDLDLFVCNYIKWSREIGRASCRERV